MRTLDRRLSSSLLVLASVGFVGMSVVLVGGALIHTGEGLEKVAGYALVAGFAGLALMPTAIMALAKLLPALLFRVVTLIGKRKRLYAASLQARNRPEQAWELAERYRTEHPEDSKALLLQALIRLRQGRREEALGIADHAVQLTRDAEGLTVRSQVWLILGGTEEALADAEDALAINPKAPFAETLAGLALSGLRRLDHAISRLRETKSRHGRSITFMALADALRLTGDRAAAEEMYRKAARWAWVEAPSINFAEGVQALAWAHLAEFALAEKFATSALSKDKRDPLASEALTLVAMGRSDLDAAFAALEPLLTTDYVALTGTLTDPGFTPLLAEPRFRRLLAWALGAQRQALQRARNARAVSGG